ncbi:hypothetical protein FisN_17Hh245 [Fistulifera solaris]|jgi:vacuolar protein sorting-associated protein 54|uniref:Vacuolar protein sorting-associated protein 54 C-terminal domain-containing protein n=1 Tax=Fistulifera solaris TaxID=1519565 RepID=A0A1Z5JH35_FISSO|nr:hypothetical protein FisN_17Hh245 [Fistulifera solaris]|eukprot:GAX13304.1 hypothetical protein FisN_17Hh245 [Fistulifera solaris]
MVVPTSSDQNNKLDGDLSNSSSQSCQNDATEDTKLSKLIQNRKLAIEQADSVLDAVGGDPYLDGFNLLGVVANPRGTAASLMSTSFHGRYTPSAGTNESTTTGGDVFTEAYNSLETTLTSVTGQMEVLNLMLEDWSRQILEDDTDAHADGIPEAQLRELPSEMQNLNLQSLQNYLERCGVAAHAFQNILLTRKQERYHLEEGKSYSVEGDTDDEASSSALQEIPEIFFQEEFDLTDPETFRKLLIAVEDESVAYETGNESKYDTTPVSDWFPLLDPDSFGSSLDRVELALLQQVRSKSSSFFEESLRFAKLQEWIESLLVDIGSLQISAQCIQEDFLDPMDIVPGADQQRMDLRRLSVVLDRIDEILRNRDAISGTISDQEDLLAIEQINFSRKLVAGSLPGQSDGVPAGDENDTNTESLSLTRVTALKTVSDDLNQYEQLVVSNLSEELLEIFIGWNAGTGTSVYSVNGSSNGKASQNVKERALEIINALQNCDEGLKKTIAAYSNRLQDMIRMTVRTMVSEFASDGTSASSGTATLSLSTGATAMSFQSFLNCLDMLFEQLLALLTSVSGVNEFCIENGISDTGCSNDIKVQEMNGSQHADAEEAEASSPMGEVIAAATELCSKSISELLRLRKEAHSLISLDEMKLMWGACQQFTLRIEGMSGHGSALRSTLMAQAKAFVERKHESNMSALAAALDSEKWTQCEVSSERQEAITRLCTGRSVVTTPKKSNSFSTIANDAPTKNPEVEVEGKNYKVVWSCLLLVEMITINIAAATHFSSLSSGIVGKVAELLRLFNSRTTHLVLGAGAMNSNAKLKSINARHLSLVTHCVGFIISLLPHMRAALMAHMPKKQHTLLNDLDQIKKEFVEHNENVLNKFVSILGGIVENNLAKTVAGTDFDARGLEPVSEPLTCCVFLDGVSTNTKRMHQVLAAFLSPDHLRDVFARIFAYIDTKVPSLLISASESEDQNFSFPSTDEGKSRLLLEVQTMIDALNGLDGVLPWEFTAVKELGRQMEYKLENGEDDELNSISLPEQSTVTASSPQEQTPEATSVTNGVDEEETPEASIDAVENAPSTVSTSD